LVGSHLWSCNGSEKLQFEYSDYDDVFFVGLFFAVKHTCTDNILSVVRKHKIEIRTTVNPIYPFGGPDPVLHLIDDQVDFECLTKKDRTNYTNCKE